MPGAPAGPRGRPPGPRTVRNRQSTRQRHLPRPDRRRRPARGDGPPDRGGNRSTMNLFPPGPVRPSRPPRASAAQGRSSSPSPLPVPVAGAGEGSDRGVCKPACPPEGSGPPPVYTDRARERRGSKCSGSIVVPVTLARAVAGAGEGSDRGVCKPACQRLNCNSMLFLYYACITRASGGKQWHLTNK